MIVPPPLAAVVGSALLLIPLPAHAQVEEESPCEVSLRHEIFNDVVESHMKALGREPMLGCDVGPWRTFRQDDWEPSEEDWEFIDRVALQLVPEPLAGSAAFGALAGLALRARRSGGRV